MGPSYRLTTSALAATVITTCAPFFSFTSSPCSSVSEFSIRRSRYPWSPSIAICAFSGWSGRGDAINLSTVPGMTVLVCSGIRAASRFCSAILADLDMRGSAISVWTLAGIALLSSFCLLLSMDSFREIHRDEWLILKCPRLPPARSKFERGVKFHGSRFTGGGLCRSGQSRRSRFGSIVLQSREQPLLHDNAEIGFYIAKCEPHSQCRMGVDNGRFCLEVLVRLENLHQDRSFRTKRSGCVQIGKT